ncbi:hypothetical protein EVAR_71154_1 [Eumeta japonica]|uniref:Uncharacterized protein n=1 Tax=Eumeta variegata TaxID=151549 RepID=A0A4C1SKF5_EUMVA|nr:hypothetical protein EVAR_71154_1 [Eumeta japonica]
MAAPLSNVLRSLLETAPKMFSRLYSGFFFTAQLDLVREATKGAADERRAAGRNSNKVVAYGVGPPFLKPRPSAFYNGGPGGHYATS